MIERFCLFYREDGQIIGSYLEIPSIKSHHYGRYLCRIETGNVNNKLEMSAWLLRSEIEQAVDSQFQILAIALAFVTAFLTVFLIYSIKYGKSVWKDLIQVNKNEHRCAAQFNQPNETA
jgi:expansin (peptidoglycan-binding protein)